MYGCIYFKEDNTLSVVNENSRNLCVTDRFAQSAECVMKWSGKNYDGVILETNGKNLLVLGVIMYIYCFISYFCVFFFKHFRNEGNSSLQKNSKGC